MLRSRVHKLPQGRHPRDEGRHLAVPLCLLPHHTTSQLIFLIVMGSFFYFLLRFSGAFAPAAAGRPYAVWRGVTPLSGPIALSRLIHRKGCGSGRECDSHSWGLCAGMLLLLLPSTAVGQLTPPGPTSPPPPSPQPPPPSAPPPGMVQWLDAQDGSSLTLSGSTVTAWRSLPPNGSVTATLGAPTFSSMAINGMPAVSFNNAQMRTNASIARSGTMSVAMVLTTAAVPGESWGTFWAHCSWDASSWCVAPRHV